MGAVIVARRNWVHWWIDGRVVGEKVTRAIEMAMVRGSRDRGVRVRVVRA